MPVETRTRSERVASEPVAEDRPRELATDHRLRRVIYLVVFVLLLPIVGAVWVLTEYYEEHTWPSRFASAPDVAGTWDPWFFWVAGIWAIVLAIGLIRRHFRRPVPEAEIEREVDRLRSRR